MLNIAINEGSHILPGANWMALLPLGMLLAAASLADDAISTATGDARIAWQTRNAISPNVAREFSYLWQMRYPVGLTTDPTEWSELIAKLRFQDNSAYRQVSHLHNLSALTLAEFGRGRLFLGVSEDGLIGIHFRGFSAQNNLRFRELARMPYLNEAASNNAVNQAGLTEKKTVPQQTASSW